MAKARPVTTPIVFAKPVELRTVKVMTRFTQAETAMIDTIGKKLGIPAANGGGGRYSGRSEVIRIALDALREKIENLSKTPDAPNPTRSFRSPESRETKVMARFTPTEVEIIDTIGKKLGVVPGNYGAFYSGRSEVLRVALDALREKLGV